MGWRGVNVILSNFNLQTTGYWKKKSEQKAKNSEEKADQLYSACLTLNLYIFHIRDFLQVNGSWLPGCSEVKHCAVSVYSITTYTGTSWAIWPFSLEGDTKICLFHSVSILHAKCWRKSGGGLPFLPAMRALRAPTPTQPHHSFTQHPPSPAPSTPHLLPTSSHLHLQTLLASSPHPRPPKSQTCEASSNRRGKYGGYNAGVWSLHTSTIYSCGETQVTAPKLEKDGILSHSKPEFKARSLRSGPERGAEDAKVSSRVAVPALLRLPLQRRQQIISINPA